MPPKIYSRITIFHDKQRKEQEKNNWIILSLLRRLSCIKRNRRVKKKRVVSSIKKIKGGGRMDRFASHLAIIEITWGYPMTDTGSATFQDSRSRARTIRLRDGGRIYRVVRIHGIGLWIAIVNVRGRGESEKYNPVKSAALDSGIRRLNWTAAIESPAGPSNLIENLAGIARYKIWRPRETNALSTQISRRKLTIIRLLLAGCGGCVNW